MTSQWHMKSAFFPCALAVFTVVIGLYKKEIPLIIAGALFLIVMIYSIISVLLLLAVYSKKYPLSKKRGFFFELPAILVRYRIQLCTKDGKTIDKILLKTENPRMTDTVLNGVYARGAYFDAGDEMLFFDIFGFFCLKKKLRSSGEEARLLSPPRHDGQAARMTGFSGGEEARSGDHVVRSDNFIDHRPYIAGDDPRRINWKLYAHAGELFVRVDEKDAPPHSELVLLLDTQVDGGLFSREEGWAACDALCSSALAIAREEEKHGVSVKAGWTGGEGVFELGEDKETRLSFPYSLPITGGEDLPVVESKHILVLALPRKADGTTALGRFLEKKPGAKVLFLERETPERGAP